MTDAIGALRHRFVLLAPINSVGEAGDVQTMWAEVTPIWGAVEALKDEDAVRGDTEHAASTIKVRMRYQTSIEVGLRIVDSARTFEITRVEDRDGTKRWMHCLCREVQS